MANSNQLDSNGSADVGDACENDCDGDSLPNDNDVCPCNNKHFEPVLVCCGFFLTVK